MTIFVYEGLTETGRTQRGRIEADSPKAARARLREQGLVPMLVEEAKAQTSKGSGLWSRRVLSAGRRATWTRQLASLVRGGLPLERALASLADEAETPAERDLVAALKAEVNAGGALSAAMASFAREFDDSYRAVVSAGESSGRLGDVLERLAQELDESEALRQKMLSAVLYPGIITVFAVAIVIFLMTYVVPQVAQAFSSSKRALPALTEIMLMISGGLRSWGWLLGLSVVASCIAWVQARRLASFRLTSDRWLMNLPWFGRLLRQYEMARFGSTLALLAASGVPILRALQTAADTMKNHAMRAQAREALAMVREGAPLAAALSTQPALSGLIVTFAKLGEQTGQLGQMLERASTQISTDVQRRTLRLATLLEPTMIVGMGGVVMLIVLSVMLPIIQLNQLVR